MKLNTPLTDYLVMPAPERASRKPINRLNISKKDWIPAIAGMTINCLFFWAALESINYET